MKYSFLHFGFSNTDLNLPADFLEILPSNPHLETLRIVYYNPDPFDLALLVKFPGLRSLALEEAGLIYKDIPWEDLSFLISLPHLTGLSLSGPRLVTDLTKGLKLLKDRYWKTLSLIVDKDMRFDLSGIKGSLFITRASRLPAIFEDRIVSTDLTMNSEGEVSVSIQSASSLTASASSPTEEEAKSEKHLSKNDV